MKLLVLTALAIFILAAPAQAAPSPTRLKAQVAKLKRENVKLKRERKKLRRAKAKLTSQVRGMEADLSTAIKAVPVERFRAVVLTPASESWPCADTTTDYENGALFYWSFSFQGFCEETDYEDLPY